MFTGIVEEVGKVISAQAGRLVIGATEAIREVRTGDSISVNGACLTVAAFGAGSFSVDVMAETLRRTNLGLLKVGDKVNLERALALGGRLGGHLVQGHVDDTGKVASVAREEGAMLIKFEASPEIMRYVVEKGFIAVDGVSLTVVSRDARSFLVSLVEYSQKHTTLGSRRAGDVVNLEVDIIAKYVEQLSQAQRTGITVDFLKEHGFLVS
ncbi:MAG: riboflavin synthase [Chloroflexi bacterium]|nr:riboflavin synthase [Chloroflexota bacterium]